MIAKISFENEIWETPILPAIPEKIKDSEKSFYSLTDEENDVWEFLFEEIEDMPSPFLKEQDYNFTLISQERWSAISVPGSLLMQGYAIKNNTEYYYKRTICIPKDYRGKKVLIRFEGVYSNARVWINNRHIKTHVGGFTWWDCDITEFTNQEEITLVIGVADIEGTEKGIWNPEGELLSNAAWASHYAHHNIGGILRDITLYTLPEVYIERTHLETILDEVYQDANLQIDLKIAVQDKLLDDKVEIKAELFDANGESIVSERMEMEECYCDGFRMTIAAQSPKLWDAEHPNLYRLCLSVYQNGEWIQENIHMVGFRQICYGGMRGTSPNKVYVNGKEVKLRGVCRHDISHQRGRCIGAKEAYQEILSYKQNNINHIRSSHYPASKHMLAACDSLGIYVEQENSACFKGGNGYGVNCEAKEFIESFAEMIESSRNHPSILIWSLANESDFEASSGFRTEYQYIKDVDITRPVIFSYPDTVKSTPCPYDIYSKHYEQVDGNLGREDMPILHDEFAHVACYNLEELKADNSVREFWGTSLKKGWDNIFHTEGALGCAIWGAIDEVFYLPSGTKESHQHHASGKAAGYGEWGAVLDVYKREKPEAYFTKKAFSPILIQPDRCKVGEGCSLYLQNRYDHTNLNEIRLVCKNRFGGKLYDDFVPTPLEPHREGEILLPEVQAKDGWLWVGFYQGEFLVEEYLFTQSEERETIKTFTSLQIDETTGCVTLIAENGKAYALGGSIRRKGNVSQENSKTKIQHERLENGTEVVTVIEEDENQWINKYVYECDGITCLLSITRNAELQSVEEESVEEEFIFAVPLLFEAEAVKFKRKGLYTTYPEDHIARNEGVAYRKRIGHQKNPDQYGQMPTWSWEADMSNFFLWDNEGEVTNDFRTKRTNIEAYTVCFEDGMELEVIPQVEELAAMVQVGQNDTLELSIGSYYKSLEWGNYCGEVPSYECGMQFSVRLALLAERGTE